MSARLIVAKAVGYIVLPTIAVGFIGLGCILAICGILIVNNWLIGFGIPQGAIFLVGVPMLFTAILGAHDFLSFLESRKK